MLRPFGKPIDSLLLSINDIPYLLIYPIQVSITSTNTLSDSHRRSDKDRLSSVHMDSHRFFVAPYDCPYGQS